MGGICLSTVLGWWSKPHKIGVSSLQNNTGAVWWIQPLPLNVFFTKGHHSGAELNTHAVCFVTRSLKPRKCSHESKAISTQRTARVSQTVQMLSAPSQREFLKNLLGETVLLAPHSHPHTLKLGVLNLRNLLGLCMKQTQLEMCSCRSVHGCFIEPSWHERTKAQPWCLCSVEWFFQLRDKALSYFWLQQSSLAGHTEVQPRQW